MAAICILVLSVGAAHSSDSADGSLMLYLPFDGTLTAVTAKGGQDGKSEIPPEFKKGVRGQALVIGGKVEDAKTPKNDIPAQSAKPGRNALYLPENIDVKNGTVSFWVMPEDWSGADGGFNVLFRTQAGENFFLLYKYMSGERLLFLRGKSGKWTSVQHRIGYWRPGQWHHLAITWSPDEMRLFVDGKLVDAKKMRFPMEGIDPVDPVSVGPGGSWDKAFIGHSRIDELRIHNRALSELEIADLYARDAGNVLLDVGYVTVGERTPVLDGKINAFEYALEDTGFSDMEGRQAAVQSRYALSYDQKNLYVAVESGLPKENDAGTANERAEIFLNPAPGREKVRRLTITPDGRVEGDFLKKKGDHDESPIALKQRVENGIWTFELALPFSALGLEKPPEGQSWRFNIARTSDQPSLTTSASPVVGRIDDQASFLEMRFQRDAPQLRIAGLFDVSQYRSALDISAQTDRADTTLKYFGTSDNVDMPAYGLRTKKYTLFENGRVTPLRAPMPPETPRALNEFGILEVRVIESRAGNDTTVYHRRFIVKDERLPMRTLFVMTKDRRQLLVSAEKRSPGSIRARFLDSKGKMVWQAQQPIPTESTYFQSLFDLDFDKLVPGLYTVKIDHVAPDGAATETYSNPYRIPGKNHPAFRTYIDPEANIVPAPWTPLEQKGSRVSLWGRTYDFSGGALFSSLVSQSRELLARPATLRLNDQDLAPLETPSVKLISSSDMAVVWKKRADLGAIIVESEITTHFDGYCEIAMTLLPGKAGAAPIRTLSLDIPLKKEFAAMVRDGQINPIVGSKAGAVGKYWFQELVHAPFIWVGNDDAGFNWLAPSLENWYVKNHSKDVEIIRKNDEAILRFNLVDTPLKMDAPRTIRFGFILTPSKPLDPKIQRGRISKDWQMWSQPWKLFGMQDYQTADRQEIRRDGKGVDEVFLYLGYNYLSPFSPDFLFFQDEWLSLQPKRTYGEYNGSSNFPSGCFTEGCIGSDTFLNFLNNRFAEFFEKAKVPLTPKAIDYYFDTGMGVSKCRNPKHEACRPWKGLDGQEHGRMLIDQHRELALNTYRMIRRTSPTAKISSHYGWRRVMPGMHFTDIIVGGEGVNSVINKNGGTYYDFLTPELFRCTFGSHIWGCRMVFLDMLVRMKRETSPESILHFSLDNPKDRRPLLHSYGYCVVHDVDIWDPYPESKPLRETIWAAQDALGWDTEVKFHPYWKSGPIKRISPNNDRVMASGYSKDGKLILAVLNDTAEEQTVKIELDLKALGVKAGQRGFDGFEPTKTYLLGKLWEDRIPARGFRLIVWAENASPAHWPANGSPSPSPATADADPDPQ